MYIFDTFSAEEMHHSQDVSENETIFLWTSNFIIMLLQYVLIVCFRSCLLLLCDCLHFSSF